MFENFDWIGAMRQSPVMVIILGCSILTFGFDINSPIVRVSDNTTDVKPIRRFHGGKTKAYSLNPSGYGDVVMLQGIMICSYANIIWKRSFYSDGFFTAEAKEVCAESRSEILRHPRGDLRKSERNKT